MNKTVRIGLIIGIILLFIAGMIYKERQVYQERDMLGVVSDSLALQKKNSDKLEKRVKTLEERNIELEEENKQLSEQNKVLRDSILLLERKIQSLNKKLREQTDDMVANRSEMDKLRAESKRLIAEITQLKQEKDSNKKLIAQLDEERLSINKKLGDVYEKNLTLEEDLLENVVEREKIKKDFKKKERILEIMNNVKVDYITLDAMKENDKSARNAKKWHHTDIKMNFTYPDSLLTKGEEEFLVKIVDKTSGAVVSPRESNVGKNAQGIPFKFEGNPIDALKYINYQEKTGKEFEAQVYYLKEGNEYQLRHGTAAILFKGDS